MRITIEEISREQEEEVILRCHEASPELLRLLTQIRTLQTGLTGFRDDEIHRLAFDEIYYFEVVDGKSFFYCRDEVFESHLKLSRGSGFFRASKSMVLNADKIDYVSPAFSGRFEATLLNQEKVMVSRQYVSVLKKKMGL